MAGREGTCVNQEWERYVAALERFTASCERTTSAIVVLGVRLEMSAQADEMARSDRPEFENRVADWLNPRWRSQP